MSIGNALDVSDILGDQDAIAREVAHLWVTWDDGRSQWKDRVEEVREYLYATDTSNTSNSSNPHSHKTHRPKITQISDNIQANYLNALMPHNDWMQFESYDEESSEADKKDLAVSYLKTKHRRNGLRETISTLLQDWSETGNCFGAVEYHREVRTGDNGETITVTEGPRPYSIDPSDIVFNPLARSFRDSPKIVRSIKTLGDIHLEMQQSVDKLGAYETTLKKVADSRKVLATFKDSDIEKSIKLNYTDFGSFTTYIKNGYVEFLDFYGDLYDSETGEFFSGHHFTVVDRTWVVDNGPIGTWDGKPYIFHSGWRKQSGNLWAMGPLDNLVGMQYMLNHLENARADAFDKMIEGDLIIQGDVDVVTNEVTGSREFYISSERGNVSYLTPDTTILSADLKQREIEELMEMYAGAPREAMGIRTPGEKTKFEVSSLQTAAGRIFQHKTNHFEITMLEPMINAELELAKKNMVTDSVQLIDQETGVNLFETITKEDLKANGKMIPVGARNYARQAQLSQELMQFMNALSMDEELKAHFPAKNIAKAWDDLLGFGNHELYEPFGRMSERLEAQKTEAAAQDAMAAEDASMSTMADQPLGVNQ